MAVTLAGVPVVRLNVALGVNAQLAPNTICPILQLRVTLWLNEP